MTTSKKAAPAVPPVDTTVESHTEADAAAKTATDGVNASPEAKAAEEKLAATVEKKPPEPVDPLYSRESPVFGTAGKQEIYAVGKGVYPGERAVLVEYNYTQKGPALTMAMITFRGVEVTTFSQEGEAI